MYVCNAIIIVLFAYFLGGAENTFGITRRKFARSFDGCLRDLFIENRNVNIVKDAREGRNIDLC